MPGGLALLPWWARFPIRSLPHNIQVLAVEDHVLGPGPGDESGPLVFNGFNGLASMWEWSLASLAVNRQGVCACVCVGGTYLIFQLLLSPILLPHHGFSRKIRGREEKKAEYAAKDPRMIFLVEMAGTCSAALSVAVGWFKTGLLQNRCLVHQDDGTSAAERG